MINPKIHRFLSIGLVLLISSAGMTWGTQAFADNHCDKNDDKKCNHSEKNQKSTPKGPVVTINPSSGPIATLVTITGNGFAPFSTVVISFEGDIRATVTSTSNGGFNATFNVPSTSSIGDHTVEASQGSNSASKTFKVTDMVSPKAIQGSSSSLTTSTATSSGVPTITLNSTSGPVGNSVNITGSGFDPSSTVVITFNGTDIITTPTTVTTSTNGEFLANFTVPLSSSVGFAPIVATQGSNSASNTFIVTSSLTTTNQSNVAATAPSSPNLSEKMILPDIFA
jgi:hypothetical protein